MNRSASLNAAVLLALVTSLGAAVAAAEPNSLTAEEKAAGWKLLFDGRSPSGWQLFKRADFPTKGWAIEDGWLVKKGGVKVGNLVTRETFTDFEFTWEWRMAKGGNNGVKYFVDDERGELGHEYQMLPQPGRKVGKGSTAGFYAVLAPKADRPGKVAPEINRSRIVVRGDQVQHWLNGELALEYTCGSEEVLANVAKSKFKKAPNFGKKVTGRLMLTDHEDECAYRNLKIRVLK